MRRWFLSAVLLVGLLGCRSGDERPQRAQIPPPAESPPPPAPQEAPPLPPDSILPPGTSSLEFLTAMVGKMPLDVDLWRTIPTMKRLKKLLGDPYYQDFLVCMQETSAIEEQNGFYYVAGNKKYGAATDAAVFVAQVNRDVIYVWMKSAGQPSEHAEPGWTGPLPPSVRAAIAKAAKG